ncbi:MAG: tetratricopeptide repeat protein [Castellaniella sp.]
MSLLRIIPLSLLLALPAGARAQVPAVANDSPFYEEAPAEGGWKALAKTLDRLAPSVDTRLPLTPSQITDRIEAMLNSGQTDQALEAIARRRAQVGQSQQPGTDVQLMFLEGRALAQAGRHTEAIDHYQHMVQYYPELPEPWNNLASEYVQQGRLDLAERALESALANNPQYATARLNLGMVQLMRARETLNLAAQLGAPGADALLAATTRILQP